MGYSKITSVEVTNFMVYSRAKLMFDDSNIVNIKGYNSSGKSTMLKAIGVCLMNMFPKSQTKLIRHGEDFFRIVVNFDDGVSILRDKYANGQSLYEMYSNGRCVFTTKEGRKLSKVEDVPEIIKQYLGLCNTSYGCLNYQSRQDKLWLVETTGSENYASLNEILKSEVISRANALINSDRNKLSAEITGLEASIQSVKMERVAAEAYTEELLMALEEKDRYVQELNRRAGAVENIQRLLEEVSGVHVTPHVDVLDVSRLRDVEGMSSAMKTLFEVKVYPSVPKVEGDRIQRVTNINNMVSSLSDGMSRVVMADVSPLSVERATSVVKVVQSAKVYSDALSAYRKLLLRIREESDTLAKSVADAEAAGIHFVKCNNCGSYTEVKEGA